MPVPGSAMIYELLGGIFGWVWILAGLATLVFAGMALFSHYPWWWAGIALLVSGVAKWLAKGFRDNRNRVMYEAHLREQGLSPEEAAKRWTENYFQGKLD